MSYVFFTCLFKISLSHAREYVNQYNKYVHMGINKLLVDKIRFLNNSELVFYMETQADICLIKARKMREANLSTIFASYNLYLFLLKVLTFVVNNIAILIIQRN